MTDCCKEDCPYPVCIEQEIADRVRAELEAQIDIFEGNEDDRTRTRKSGTTDGTGDA